MRFHREQLHDEEKIARAEADPKLKMSLCFRWSVYACSHHTCGRCLSELCFHLRCRYLSKSSNWANRGIPDRKLDYQIWCGPAIGSFNAFIKGSHQGHTRCTPTPCTFHQVRC